MFAAASQRANQVEAKRSSLPEQRAKHTAPSSSLTFPGGLEAVEDVYSLDVIGQRGVGQQGAVPIDCVQGKFKGEFLCTGGAALDGFKDSS